MCGIAGFFDLFITRWRPWPTRFAIGGRMTTGLGRIRTAALPSGLRKELEQIPTFLVSKLARQDVSVILTGDAGDELFCGYGRYSAERFPGSTPQDRIEAYRIHVSQWLEPERIIPGASEPLNTLSRPDSHLRMGEICDQVMHLDTITYLPDDLLVKLDHAAMAVSLETRAPFLDHKVHEFAWRLPFGMKVREDKRKWILRQVLYEHVPPELVDRPKQGFEVPLFSWLTGPLREWAAGLLDESRLRREGFFDAAAIQERWQQLLGGHQRFKHLMWTILMFEAWLDFYRKSD
jgi:asparagine synthase (glutamine-hydrolysing)